MKNGKEEKARHLLHCQALAFKCMDVRRTVNFKGKQEAWNRRKRSKKSLIYRVLADG